MKTSVLVGRLLLGLIFFVFGLNGFLLFITPPEHTPVGNAFINLLMTTGFMYVEKAFEIIGGALLLLDLYVPLGLAVVAAIVVSILMFHLLMERNTLVIGLVPFLLWGFLASGVSPAVHPAAHAARGGRRAALVASESFCIQPTKQSSTNSR